MVASLRMTFGPGLTRLRLWPARCLSYHSAAGCQDAKRCIAVFGSDATNEREPVPPAPTPPGAPARHMADPAKSRPRGSGRVQGGAASHSARRVRTGRSEPHSRAARFGMVAALEGTSRDNGGKNGGERVARDAEGVPAR